MSGDERFDELAAALLAGIATPAEKGELEASLAEDGAARARFARLLRHEVALRQVCRQAAGELASDRMPALERRGSGSSAGHRAVRSSRSGHRRGTGAHRRRGTGPHRRASGTAPHPRHHRARPQRSGPAAVGGWRIAALAAGGVAVIALIALLRGPAPAPAETWTVTVSEGRTLVDGEAVTPGATIRSDQEVHAVGGDAIPEDGDHRLRLATGARCFVRQRDHGWRIDLEAGLIDCRIPAQAEGRIFKVRSHHAFVDVVGTRFTVEDRGTETGIRVAEGSVRVRPFRGAATRVLGLGERAACAVDRFLDQTPEAEPRPAAPPHEPAEESRVASLTLIDAERDRPIAAYDPIPPGARISFAAIGTRKLNVRANVRGVAGAAVQSVGWTLDGEKIGVRHEHLHPFAMKGDREGDYYEWRPEVGTHVIEAQAHTDDRLGAPTGPPYRLRIEFTE